MHFYLQSMLLETEYYTYSYSLVTFSATVGHLMSTDYLTQPVASATK